MRTSIYMSMRWLKGLVVLPLALAFALPADAQRENLIPNGDFSAEDPLEFWRYEFPYDPAYGDNHHYISANKDRAQRGYCIEMAVPRGAVEGYGARFESGFAKAKPGATYRVMVDCYPVELDPVIHVEAFSEDPRPNPGPDYRRFTIPATDDYPALVVSYRAQLPRPEGRNRWQTMEREFTLPEKVRVRGREVEPEYLAIKVSALAPRSDVGRAYFDNFRLYEVTRGGDR